MSLSSPEQTDIYKLYSGWGYSILRHNQSDKAIWFVQNACSRCALYVYHDDPETLYLSSLYVSSDYRRYGFASVLLGLAETSAQLLHCSVFALSVKPDTWLQSWYERRGFSAFNHSHCPKDSHVVWLRKLI